MEEGDLRLIESHPENLTLEPAHWYPVKTSKVRVREKVASSPDSSPSSGNFTITETLLRPNSAILVELTALKQMKPVQIILTSEDTSRAYSCETLSELCETTYSVMTETGIPMPWDEVAVRLSPTGAVYISHNNNAWIKKLHVDACLEYHVLFAMEHVSALTLIGIATCLSEINEAPLIDQEVLPVNDRSTSLPECVVCLENEREVAVIPCYHVALCAICANILKTSQESKCPICRVVILDVKKLHLS